MVGKWRVRLLGSLRLEGSGEVIDRFRTQKTAALLGYLALHLGERVPRDVLADILWPDSPTDAARHSVSMALSSLRQQLEPPGVKLHSVLFADRHVVGLNPDAVETDVTELLSAIEPGAPADQLKKAIELIRGEFLAGLYEDWIVSEQERFSSLGAEAALRLAAVHREAGDQTGETWAKDRVRRIDPLSEHVMEEPRATLVPTPETPSPLRSPELLTGQVPLSLTRFVGRSPDLERIDDFLTAGVRLLTLTGPPGIGKTRLALESARGLEAHVNGAVWFVDLTQLDDGVRLREHVMRSVLPLNTSPDPLLELQRVLGKKRALLVLDNADQYVSEAGKLAKDLLQACSGLAILVTSPRPLRIMGEQELVIGPLPVPEKADSLEVLATVPSVALIVDRARGGRPDFQVTASNADAIISICRRLEGHPLAIELAASRLTALTARQIDERLEASLDELRTRYQDVHPRHRSITAALNWSYRLLPPELRGTFADLSVFKGSFDEEAVSVVLQEALALDDLTLLRDHSLLQAEESGGVIRFRMLEMVRRFAGEKLQPERRMVLKQRHAERYLEWVERLSQDPSVEAQIKRNAAFEAAHPNLRLAIETFLESGQTNLAARIAAGLGVFWIQRDYAQDAIRCFERMVALGGLEKSTRADVLNGLALSKMVIVPKEDQAELYEDSIAISAEIGDKSREARGHQNLGVLHSYFGRFDLARICYERSLELRRELGDRGGEGSMLANLSGLAGVSGDLEKERSFLLQGIQALEEAGSMTSMVHNLFNLAALEWEGGDLEKARAILERARAAAEQMNDLRAVARIEYGLARTACLVGELKRALAHAKTSLRIADQLADEDKLAYGLEAMAEALVASGQELPARESFAAACSLRREGGRGLAPREQARIAAIRDAVGDVDHTLSREHAEKIIKRLL